LNQEESVRACHCPIVNHRSEPYSLILASTKARKGMKLLRCLLALLMLVSRTLVDHWLAHAHVQGEPDSGAGVGDYNRNARLCGGSTTQISAKDDPLDPLFLCEHDLYLSHGLQGSIEPVRAVSWEQKSNRLSIHLSSEAGMEIQKMG
jgi:hypothetical protein